MHTTRIFRKILFRLRVEILSLSPLRRLWWTMLGMQIGKGTAMPRSTVTWPHRVKIGAYCRLQPDIYWHIDGVYDERAGVVIGDNTFIGMGCEFNTRASISIGSDCLIAAGSRFVDHDHGILLGKLMRLQLGPQAPIVVENNVWIGADCIVLKGVRIGSGAVVAAGSVVTRSIPENAIAAGSPARVLRLRAPDEAAETLPRSLPDVVVDSQAGSSIVA